MNENISSTVSDTVGFINKLPTILVESFKSTLEEAINADILLHVIDYSNEDFKEKINTVDKILDDLGLSKVPKILIKNKIDISNFTSEEILLNESYISQIETSAKLGNGLDDLRLLLIKASEIIINERDYIYV